MSHLISAVGGGVWETRKEALLPGGQGWDGSSLVPWGRGLGQHQGRSVRPPPRASVWCATVKGGLPHPDQEPDAPRNTSAANPAASGQSLAEALALKVRRSGLLIIRGAACRSGPTGLRAVRLKRHCRI